MDAFSFQLGEPSIEAFKHKYDRSGSWILMAPGLFAREAGATVAGSQVFSGGSPGARIIGRFFKDCLSPLAPCRGGLQAFDGGSTIERGRVRGNSSGHVQEQSTRQRDGRPAVRSWYVPSCLAEAALEVSRLDR